MVEEEKVYEATDPRFIEEHFPVVREPKIPTMDRKVIIEAAIPGWQPIWWYRERGVKNLPPLTIEEQVDAIVECVKAGASVIHTHPRHPSDFLPRIHDGELLAEIMDGAFEQVDFITAHHTWTWDLTKSRATDYISYTKELLERGGGNKYVQGALVMNEGTFVVNMPVSTAQAIKKGVAWMEANGVKPMYSVQSYSFTELKRIVFDSEISKWKPYWIAIQMGKHLDDQIFADPWSYLQVINNISMVRQALGDDAFIGVHTAGRNWLPAAVVALLYGAELVRVGLEDQLWLYPHRDDISHKASDTVEIVANIVRAIGREVATVNEARDRLKIKPPPGK